MLSYSWYLLKVIICSGILFGYYWFFLRNKIFHQYNRFYLLSAMLLSLLLPVLKINFWQPDSGQNTAISVLQAVSTGDEYMSNFVITPSKYLWSVDQLYVLAYLLISLLFLFVLIRTLYRIMLLLKKYPVQQIEQVAFVNTEDASTPFSFFRYIFWNNNIDINTTTGRQIFKHEVAHIQEKHTYDKLFVNLVLILCWCNPFFWLYRKELNMIHEFIADKKAVENSDTSAFAAMILQAAYPKHQFSLTNNFFYSPIKRRLMMLNKIDNPKLSYIVRLIVLPLAVLVFAAFTFKAKSFDKNLLPDQAINPVVENISISPASPASVKSMIRDTLPDNEPLDIHKVLLIVNGKIIGKGKKAVEEINNIKAETVSVKWLTKVEAIAKYGPDGADGACESTYKEGALFTTTYVDANNKSIFYIGLENPLQVIVAHVKPEDLIVSISEGSISGTNGKYVVRVTHPGEVKLTLSKRDGTVLPFTYTINVKRVPDPGDPAFPENLKYKINSERSNLMDLKLKILQENKTLIQKVYAEKQLNAAVTDDLKLTWEPIVYIGTYTRGRIQLEYLKAQTEIRLTPGYTLVNATVYFHGPGFEGNVVAVTINSKSHPGIVSNFNRCKDGAQIVFDNVHVKDKNGNIQKLEYPPVYIVGFEDQEKNLQGNTGNKIFTKVEVDPQFTGGEEAWQKYLQANLQVNKAVSNGAKTGQYTLVLNFIVNEDGTLREIKCENDPGYGMCTEAVRVMANTIKWQPGLQNGRKVNAYKKQSITFVID